MSEFNVDRAKARMAVVEEDDWFGRVLTVIIHPLTIAQALLHRSASPKNA